MVAGGEWEPLADNIIHRPSPNYGYGDQKPWWRAVTWHITEGSTESALNWLTNPSSDASAHLVIGRDGALYNLVALSQAAWCHGRVASPDKSNPIIAQTVAQNINPNLRALSIECAGYTSFGKGGSLTGAQSDTLIRATAYLCWRFKLTADRTHILGHYQWDSVNRANCPGYSHDEWQEWVNRAGALCKLWRGW